MEYVIQVLDEIGASDSIFAAIDTYDMAHIVRTATEAISLPFWLLNPNILSLVVQKNRAESITFRIAGNEYYKVGNDGEAIKHYNKALALAPKHSEELMLAYGNRSAVFLRIGYTSACINDINICLSMRCSELLSKKLKKRLKDAVSLSCQKVQYPDENFVKSFLRLNNRNADVPCVSDDVIFEDGTKRVMAKRDIKPGTLVAFEKAFATCTKNRDMSCYYCYKIDLCLHPCDNCVEALFCSESCRAQCFKEYHYIDCHIADHVITGLNPVNKLMSISAIKLSLELGWDGLIAASKDIGATRLNSATVSQAFNYEDPLSILGYDDDKVFLEGRLFNGSIVCAAILKNLGKVPNYFPKDASKRRVAQDAMARVMLTWYATFTNKIPIECAAIHSDKVRVICKGQSNFGWFSFSSKLKHSCEPNLYVVGLNDSVALLSMGTIKKGEELTISYIGHYYELNIDPKAFQIPARAVQLFVETQMICSCRACIGYWDFKSVVTSKLTTRQAKLHNDMVTSQAPLRSGKLRTICEALDVLPGNSTQHRQAYHMLKHSMNLMKCIFTGNIFV